MYVHVCWRSVETWRVWVVAAVRLRLRSCVVVVAVMVVFVIVSFAGERGASMCAGTAVGNVDVLAIVWGYCVKRSSRGECLRRELWCRREVLAGLTSASA
jgi:hypothetical protein